MTTLSQARFDRLFRNQVKPEAVTNKDGLTFWEKELVESQDQQQSTCLQDDSDEQIAPSNDDPAPNSNKIEIKDKFDAKLDTQLPQSFTRSNDQSQNVNPDLFSPTDTMRRHAEGLSAEPILDNENEEIILEPASSSSQLEGVFCVLSQVTKLPYRYIRKLQGPAEQLFVGGKIFERGWKVYYLHGPATYAFKPIVLVPFDQVQTLFRDIETVLENPVRIPGYPFCLSFYGDNTPKPVFLAVVNSKADLTEAQSKIPGATQGYDAVPDSASATDIQDHTAWREKIECALESEKKKRSNAKKRKNSMIAANDSLQKAQRFLGFQSRPPVVEAIRHGLIESVQDPAPRTPPHRLGSQILDFTNPAPFAFEGTPILITIDVESYELAHDLITEIGISTLDTTSIQEIAPGLRGENWIKQIRSRHFRIKGREHLINSKFVHGHPDMFQFGKSESVALEHVHLVINSCFDHPYSASHQCQEPLNPEQINGDTISWSPVTNSDIDSNAVDTLPEPRNILLIGHGIGGDIQYLATVDGSIFSTASATPASSTSEASPSRQQQILSCIRERFDTAKMYKSILQEKQTRSLTRVCDDLGIPTPYTHNAGNDARYTMEAFIKMTIKCRQMEDEVEIYGGDRAKPVDGEKVQTVEDNMKQEVSQIMDGDDDLAY